MPRKLDSPLSQILGRLSPELLVQTIAANLFSRGWTYSHFWEACREIRNQNEAVSEVYIVGVGNALRDLELRAEDAPAIIQRTTDILKKSTELPPPPPNEAPALPPAKRRRARRP